MKKRTLALILALVLVFGAAVGGTIAYLTDTTGPVTNTFTVGKVDITLTETFNTDTNNDGTNDAWKAQLIPGTTYTKDPVVTVTDDSEDCWLFVKFEEKNDAATYLTYTSNLNTANGWTQGDGTNIPSNVWYRAVNKDDGTKSFQLLAGDSTYPTGCISVKNTVTNGDMDTASDAQLVYTAYACQKANMSAIDAWTAVKPTT